MDMGQIENEMSYEDLLECALELGQRMVQSGAEVRRVEDTITRVLHAYGAESSEVFSISSLVLATVKWENGHKNTQSKRINGFGINLRKLELYNELARYICRIRPGVTEIRERLKEIARSRKRNWVDMAGYFLSSGALTIFFGGNFRDALAAGLIGLFVFLFDQFVKDPGANKLVYTLFACMVTGWLAILAVDVGLASNVNAIMIGDIMLFIPTLALCNSLKDVLHGDILTGVYRCVEAIMIAVAIAAGYFVADLTLGGISGSVAAGTGNVPLPVQIITAVLGVVGFSIFFHIQRAKIWTAAIGGSISWVIYLMIFAWTENLFFSNAVAAIAVCFFSEVMARVLKAPANIFLIPAVIPLLPGNRFYMAVASLISGDMQQFFEFAKATLSILLGIEIGFMIAFILFTKSYGFFRDGYHRYQKKSEHAEKIHNSNDV